MRGAGLWNEGGLYARLDTCYLGTLTKKHVKTEQKLKREIERDRKTRKPSVD